MQKHQRLTFVVSRVSFCVVCCQLLSRGFRIYPWEVNPTGSGCIMAKPKGEMTTWPSERSFGPNEKSAHKLSPAFHHRLPPCYFLPKYHLDCLIILVNHVQEACFESLPIDLEFLLFLLEAVPIYICTGTRYRQQCEEFLLRRATGSKRLIVWR